MLWPRARMVSCWSTSVLAVLLFAQGCAAFQAREVDGLDDMSELLTSAGFPQYASPTFLNRLYDVLGYDTVADLALIYEDALGSDDFQELGIRHEDALTIQRAAKVQLVAWRIAKLRLEDGTKTMPDDRTADSLATQLYAAGYEEPESLRWIERKEAMQLGLTESEWRSLIRLPPPPPRERDEL